MDEKWRYSDAFRDVYLDQETEENGDGWSIVATRMRRRAIRRRVTSCAAAMVPIAVLVGIGMRHSADTTVIDTLPAVPAVAEVHRPEMHLSEPIEIEEIAARHSVKPANKPVRNTLAAAPEATYQVISMPETEPEETIMTVPEEPVRTELRTEPKSAPTYVDEFSTLATDNSRNNTHRMTLGLNASVMPGMGSAFPVMADAMLMSNAVGFESMNSYAVSRAELSYENAQFNHHTPVGTGISASFGLTERFYLETGLNYTLLRSDVLKSSSLIADEQRLHFVGIPVRLYWKALDWNGCTVYAGFGGEADKCIKATLGSESFSEKAIQWSANATAGIQYTLTRNLALYFQPEYSYHINETKLRTVRTDDHTDFSLRCGLRFML